MAVTALAVVTVVVAVSELLLLTDGDGAAMQENRRNEAKNWNPTGKLEGEMGETG